LGSFGVTALSEQGAFDCLAPPLQRWLWEQGWRHGNLISLPRLRSLVDLSKKWRLIFEVKFLASFNRFKK
jgi:hypothetical protein